MSCAFLSFQHHPMVRHGRNKLHSGEYSGWRANYSHVPHKSGNHGRRHDIWPERTFCYFFNHVVIFLSVESGWCFDSVQSLAISRCPFRRTIGAGFYIQTPKSLYSKGVLNIQNPKDDFYFLWCILAYIHRADQHAARTSKYEPFMHELNTTGLQFPHKNSDTPNFETLNQTISVNVLVYEDNEVFPLYASKHRHRKHHVNSLMISNSEGKFHYLLVRDLSTLVHGRTKDDGYSHVCPYCLYCFSPARLLRAHLPDCSIHPEQRWSTHHRTIQTIRRKI